MALQEVGHGMTIDAAILGFAIDADKHLTHPAAQSAHHDATGTTGIDAVAHHATGRNEKAGHQAVEREHDGGLMLRGQRLVPQMCHALGEVVHLLARMAVVDNDLAQSHRVHYLRGRCTRGQEQTYQKKSISHIIRILPLTRHKDTKKV